MVLYSINGCCNELPTKRKSKPAAVIFFWAPDIPYPVCERRLLTNSSVYTEKLPHKGS